MAQFSKKERMIASALSATPRLKRVLKKVYVSVNYILHHKRYKLRLSNKFRRPLRVILPIVPLRETFFGYYDKSPENKAGMVIYNETYTPTNRKPSAKKPIRINIIDRRLSKEPVNVGETLSYTWQQGCRAQWLNEDALIYNLFDAKTGDYKSAVFNIQGRCVTKIYDYPVQDSYKADYFLSINYRRIMNLRPDYGYRNLPLLSRTEMDNLSQDGIWKVSLATGNGEIVVSLATLRELTPKDTFDNAMHKVNHVMISPNGQGFIFIHRWYVGQRRYDRLVYYDFENLRILADDNMVSHMCWINDNIVFGYLRYSGKAGFYFIDIRTGQFTPCHTIDKVGNGDGHPSCHGDWIVFDSYPDKGRMQHLYLYNYRQDRIYSVLEVFHGQTFTGESRCDLHPRFSPDGSRVYFDTVYSGKRRLAFIDISSVTSK